MPPETTPANREYLLERVDDAAIVQVYADGFEDLPVRDRILAWHLAQAAIAGRDIFYDQRYRSNLDMRDLLEAILVHRAAIEDSTRAEIERYTKLFWLNTGPYNNFTARKFVLRCSPEALAAAAHRAAEAGATFRLLPGETLDDLLARLRPCFFDPAFDATVTAKTPPPGHDILTASANNLYHDVTIADLQGFNERYALNSRVVKRADGTIEEEVYHIGGRYGRYLEEIVTHLKAAIPYASAATGAALRALIAWYQSGEDADRVAYDIAWVHDQDSSIDTINGFVEVYLDARSAKGAWEAIVSMVNPVKTHEICAIAAHAQWFEDHMPWDPQYRKTGVRGVTARAIDVLIETGDAGPITPVGINLPNDQRIRERHGSKSVALSNITDAYERSTVPEYRSEFSWSDDEAARAHTWSAVAGELTTNMHEVIGHGSGKVSERLTVASTVALREHFSTIEEARADLVALYFLPDRKLVDIGLVAAANHDVLIRAGYEAYARNALVQLRRIRHGTHIEEDHMRNRQLIVQWLIANTSAVEQRRRDDKTYYVVVDPARFREGVGALLADVQRIKAEGDYIGAKALIEAYGVRFDPVLRDEVVDRVDRLQLPSYTGFVMPHLEASRDADGVVVDVGITYPRDLMGQMLAFSAATKHLRS